MGMRGEKPALVCWTPSKMADVAGSRDPGIGGSSR